jgi:putative YhdH/YhfP family quinone oxidoreductase
MQRRRNEMENKVFRSFLITENNDDYEQSIVEKDISDLPDHEVLIQVKYSSLNYKDALSSIGNKGVTKEYPHTPGIDAAGVVVESKSDTFNTGEKVIVTGYDLGMNTSGGFQEYIRVPAEWIVPLPENLTLKESMIYGTAGFTAALSVNKLISDGLKPSDGKILVTGATGGVGSTAIRLLNKLNYEVVAATGKLEEKALLQSMGAAEVIDRKKVDDDSKKPLLKTQWAGVIDTVGGNTLSTAIKMTSYGGNVTTCGNVAGHQFDASVYPFILRGITLYGIDSVQCPRDLREDIWNKLAKEWKPKTISQSVNEISLEALPETIDQMLKGSHKGRTIINLSF